MKQMEVSEIQVISNGRTDMGNIDELASSISDKGILVPLIVNNRNELVAGHRRLEAAKTLGMKKVPAIVIQSSGANSEEVQIIENLHRKDLTGIEEAEQYRNYMDKYTVDAKYLGDMIKKTEQYIQRRLNLLKISKKCQKALSDGKIEIGHAQILGQMSPKQQTEALKFIVDWGLTVQNFADNVRWLQKIDIGNVSIPDQPKQKTILESVGSELQSEIEHIDSDLFENPAFRKELATYLESERQKLKDKAIKVFNTEEELTEEFPLAKEVPGWGSEFQRAVASLQGSKTFAVVIIQDDYSGLERKVFRLKPKAEKKKELAESEQTPEVTEKEVNKLLNQTRKEKLKVRIGSYRRKRLLDGTEALLVEGSRKSKVMTLWALMQPQKSGWSWDQWAQDLASELGFKKTDYSYGYTNSIQKLSQLTMKKLDGLIQYATARKFNQLSEDNLKMASELAGFNWKKHWELDEEFLEIHTKAQLEKLAKELEMDLTGKNKKDDMITVIYEDWQEGQIPKILGK